jgi:hypothetical protein
MSWVNKYSTLCYGLNKFRGKHLLNKSHNKLHGLTVCNEWLPPLCTPHIQTQIQPQRPGLFSSASQRAPVGRYVKTNLQTLNPFQHDEDINYTLDSVLIYPVTTKIQASFKTVTKFNGCDRRKLRMDQHHFSYILHLHLSHLADALIQSDLQIGAFTLWHPVEQLLHNTTLTEWKK